MESLPGRDCLVAEVFHVRGAVLTEGASLSEARTTAWCKIAPVTPATRGALPVGHKEQGNAVHVLH